MNLRIGKVKDSEALSGPIKFNGRAEQHLEDGVLITAEIPRIVLAECFHCYSCFPICEMIICDLIISCFGVMAVLMIWTELKDECYNSI